MGFFQISGMMLVLFSGIMLGTSLNRSADEALIRAEGFVKLLREVQREVSCFSIPAEEILRRMEPSVLKICGWRGENPPKGFSELFEGCEIPDGEGKRILSRFVSEFGRGYREDQLALCEYCLSMMEAEAEALRDRLGGRKRVNMTLCAAGSAALAILLL